YLFAFTLVVALPQSTNASNERAILQFLKLWSESRWTTNIELLLNEPMAYYYSAELFALRSHAIPEGLRIGDIIANPRALSFVSRSVELAPREVGFERLLARRLERLSLQRGGARISRDARRFFTISTFQTPPMNRFIGLTDDAERHFCLWSRTRDARASLHRTLYDFDSYLIEHGTPLFLEDFSRTMSKVDGAFRRYGDTLDKVVAQMGKVVKANGGTLPPRHPVMRWYGELAPRIDELDFYSIWIQKTEQMLGWLRGAGNSDEAVRVLRGWLTNGEGNDLLRAVFRPSFDLPLPVAIEIGQLLRRAETTGEICNAVEVIFLGRLTTRLNQLRQSLSELSVKTARNSELSSIIEVLEGSVMRQVRIFNQRAGQLHAKSLRPRWESFRRDQAIAPTLYTPGPRRPAPQYVIKGHVHEPPVPNHLTISDSAVSRAYMLDQNIDLLFRELEEPTQELIQIRQWINDINKISGEFVEQQYAHPLLVDINLNTAEKLLKEMEQRQNMGRFFSEAFPEPRLPSVDPVEMSKETKRLINENIRRRQRKGLRIYRMDTLGSGN
ncbi:hypothetical protein ACFLRA_00480, partial [Bdellovibrionota bacterium]